MQNPRSSSHNFKFIGTIVSVLLTFALITAACTAPTPQPTTTPTPPPTATNTTIPATATLTATASPTSTATASATEEPTPEPELTALDIADALGLREGNYGFVEEEGVKYLVDLATDNKLKVGVLENEDWRNTTLEEQYPGLKELMVENQGPTWIEGRYMQIEQELPGVFNVSVVATGDGWIKNLGSIKSDDGEEYRIAAAFSGLYLDANGKLTNKYFPVAYQIPSGEYIYVTRGTHGIVAEVAESEEKLFRSLRTPPQLGERYYMAYLRQADLDEYVERYGGYNPKWGWILKLFGQDIRKKLKISKRQALRNWRLFHQTQSIGQNLYILDSQALKVSDKLKGDM